MAKLKGQFVVDVLEFLFTVAERLPRPLETPFDHVKRLRRLEYKEYYDAMYGLHRRGIVSITKKQGKNFITLTKRGALEMLLEAASVTKQAKWDGKWRVIIFDIPEAAHLERDRLRFLLKQNGFKKLQGSVFVHAYPLNRKALRYLQESGLFEYIRILKVEEMDNDADLRKHFGV